MIFVFFQTVSSGEEGKNEDREAKEGRGGKKSAVGTVFFHGKKDAVPFALAEPKGRGRQLIRLNPGIFAGDPL